MNAGLTETDRDFADLVEERRLLAHDTEFIVSGPQLGKHQVEAAAVAANSIFKMMLSMFQTRFDASIWAFGEATGHSPDDVDIYAWDKGSYTPDTLARVDAVLTNDGLKFVEFNIGSSVGGFEEASLRFLVGMPQDDAPIIAWGHYMAKRVPPDSLGILIDDESALADIRLGVETLARHLSTTTGLIAVVCSQKDLVWDGKSLRVNERRVDWVYPLFFPKNVRQDPSSYDALKAALSARSVVMPVPHSSKLFGSKLVLALLHEAAAIEPNDSMSRQLVERWVAWTARLESSLLPFALDRRADLVLKPALGLGGKGVVIGREHTPDSWRDSLDDALACSDEKYVLQRFHEPPTNPVVTSRASVGRQEYPAQSVWGIHVLDGKAGGAPFLRCIADKKSAVINQSRGAAVGGPALT